MTQQKPHTDNVGHLVSQASYTLLLKLGVILLGITAVIFVIAWFVFSDRPSFEPSLEHGLPVSAADGSGPLAQPGLVAITVNGIEWDAAQPLDPPQTIEIDGFRFTISPPYFSEEQFWGAETLSANHAGWLENSIINYVFRLPASKAYQELLVAAANGQNNIILTTSQGKRFEYSLNQGIEQPTAVSQRRITQTSPAVTLLWLDGEQSYMLTGDYLPQPQELEMLNLPHWLSLTDETAAADSDHLSVRLESVDIQADGMQLLVRGTITNSGLNVGSIGESEIHLTGDGMVSRILSVNPAFPWRIPAGNSQIAFAVTLQRPPVDEGQLIIGPQGFSLLFNEVAE